MVLQEANRVADELGGQIETWTEVAAVWTHIEAASAVPIRTADRETAEITHRIVLRRDERVQVGRRLLAGTRLFEIRALRDLDETRRYFLCLTREKEA